MPGPGGGWCGWAPWRLPLTCLFTFPGCVAHSVGPAWCLTAGRGVHQDHRPGETRGSTDCGCHPAGAGAGAGVGAGGVLQPGAHLKKNPLLFSGPPPPPPRLPSLQSSWLLDLPCLWAYPFWALCAHELHNVALSDWLLSLSVRIFLFICFDGGGADSERERPNPKQAPAVSAEPDAGLEPTNREPKSRAGRLAH